MKTSDALFFFLRSALWGKRLKPIAIPQGHFRQLMIMAREQTVDGLVCKALLDKENGITLTRYDVAEVLTTQKYVADSNRRVNEEVKALCQLLQRHQVRFVVVKGQTISCLTGDGGVRMPGDIDIYCDAEHFNRAREVIEQAWQLKMAEATEDEELHHSFTHNGVHFELHFCLLRFANRNNQQYFNELVDASQDGTAEIDGVLVPTLSPTVNLVYTFLHLYHHFIELGCGLRQFCDIAMLCSHYQGLADANKQTGNTAFSQQAIDKQLLEEILERLGFTRAFKAVGAVLIDKLGMAEELFPMKVDEKDRTYIDDILQIVIKRGNFGMYRRKHRVRAGTLYYIDTLRIKLHHYRLFYHLSPKEIRSALLHSIPHKVTLAIRRMTHHPTPSDP